MPGVLPGLVKTRTWISAAGHVVAHATTDRLEEIGDRARARRRSLGKVLIGVPVEEPRDQVVEIAKQPAALDANLVLHRRRDRLAKRELAAQK